jgi:hypothetical protein
VLAVVVGTEDVDAMVDEDNADELVVGVAGDGITMSSSSRTSRTVPIKSSSPCPFWKT